jgi:hypothetical protein
MPSGATNTGDSTWSVSENVFEQLRAERAVFSDLIAFVPLSFDKVAVRYGSEPEEAIGDMVSGNFFEGLGVRLTRGNGFTSRPNTLHYGWRSKSSVLPHGALTALIALKPRSIPCVL